MLLVSDFNLQNFATYLDRYRHELDGTSTMAPLGQVAQTLLDGTLSLWHPAASLCLVWTRPEAVLPTFQRALAGYPVDARSLDREVDEFTHAVRQAAQRVPMLLVVTWFLPPLHSGHGLLDLHAKDGAARLLMQANLHLLTALDGMPSVSALNGDRWLQMAGVGACSPRLWYGAKIPFSNDLFKLAAADVVAAVRGLRGRYRKLILVDLDDTLWGGVVGDAGWENLQLGGHDPVGEALVDFQHELKAFTRRGVALGILSKNEESVAMEAIRRHPEMVLRPEDFAGWRINWEDKAKNLAELVRELNLGTDSVVFIDDNPSERARIREAFPEVLVPDWPQDKRLYRQALLGLDCFQKPSLSEEDRQRVQMYAQDRQRADARSSLPSVEEWLASLRLSVTVRPLNPADLSRITQLLNKTNQMNLSTRRLTEPELLAWLEAPGRALWGLRVADRFGDYGLTGIVSVESTDAGQAHIIDFVLSCRVMGRRVEETMLHVAVEWARAHHRLEIRALYQATAKNRPCLEFFRRSGFAESTDGSFSWDATQAYPLPEHIQLLHAEDSTTSEVVPATGMKDGGK